MHFKETDNGTDPPTITEHDDAVSVVVGFPELDSELSPEARALFTGVFSPADGSISGSINIVDQSCQNAVQTSLLPPPMDLACHAEPFMFLALPSCMLSYSFRFKIPIPD